MPPICEIARVPDCPYRGQPEARSPLNATRKQVPAGGPVSAGPLSSPSPMPHFTLVTLSGDSLGAVELESREWPTGSLVNRSGKPNLRVVGRPEGAERLDDPEVFAILVVEET